MALILFFGSVFVTIVESVLFKLIETAKERSIDVAEVLVGGTQLGRELMELFAAIPKEELEKCIPQRVS